MVTPRCSRMLFLGVALAGLLPAAAHAAPTPTPASPADRFTDSLGVNTNLSNGDTAYCAQFSAVQSALDALGVRGARGGMKTTNTATNTCPSNGNRTIAQSYADLATNRRTLMLLAGGIDTGAGVGDADTYAMATDSLSPLFQRVDLAGTLNDTLDYAEQIGAAKLAGIEGPNEYDGNAYVQTVGSCGQTSATYPWRSRLRTWIGWLYTAVKARTALSSVPVVGPTFGRGCNAKAFMFNGFNATAGLDQGAMHLYSPGPYEAALDTWEPTFRQIAGGDPLVATEVGYSSATGASGGGPIVSEEARATYLPRVFLENYRRGIPRTYWYQLLDQSGSSTTSPEDAFGLVGNVGGTLVRRPAFYALRQLALATADPGPAFSPQPLTYEVTGDLTGVRQVVLGRRDGSHILAVWRTDSVSDLTTRADLTVTPRALGLQLGGGTYDVATLRPSSASLRSDSAPVSWVPLASSAASASFSLTGDVLLLKITKRP